MPKLTQLSAERNRLGETEAYCRSVDVLTHTLTSAKLDLRQAWPNAQILKPILTPTPTPTPTPDSSSDPES